MSLRNLTENALRDVLDKYKVKNEAWAIIMSQCCHESSNFYRLVELTHWKDAHDLYATFRSHFSSVEEAALFMSLDKTGEAIYNHVYANRYGNGNDKSGDGYRYRGRGVIQITFKDNYRKYGILVEKDLVNHPEWASYPKIAAEIAYSYFLNTPGLMLAAKKGDVRRCTELINGGRHGLEKREKLYHTYLKLI